MIMVYNENDMFACKGDSKMELGFIILIVAILCVMAIVREFKAQNMFGVAFAGISALVFGFFSIATLYWELIRPLFES